MAVSIEDYYTDYIGPEYVITPQVSTFHGITRFGRSSDITDFFSPNQDAQASYVAGLVVLAGFSMAFFAFWAIALLTFKCMGENGGALSGSPFKVRSADKVRCINRPVAARILFLVATLILWFSAVLLLAKGVSALDDTANAADNTLLTLRSKIEAAEDITVSIQVLGKKSVKIRDKVVYLFDSVICDSTDILDNLGVSLSDIKERARTDLTQLSNFLYESLEALLSGINMANDLTTSAESVVSEIRFGGWPAILVSGFLFILPAFFVVGVLVAFKNIKAKQFQLYLSYVVLPLFMGVVGFCIVVCCILIPMAAVNADLCAGGGLSSGGPDDTILTSYRNLLGNDQSTRFYIVAYYTQRCFPDYYPYDFLGKYFEELSTAQLSVDALIKVLGGNLDVIQNKCGTDDGELFLSLARTMKSSLDLLKQTVDDALSLVNCEDINNMYVNAMHSATCSHAPAAMGWIYGTLLAISVSGMIMITLRSSYLLSEQEATISENKSLCHDIKSSSDSAKESEIRLQKLFHDRQSKYHFSTHPRMTSIPENGALPCSTTITHNNEMPFELRSLEFMVITPDEQDDDVSAL